MESAGANVIAGMDVDPARERLAREFGRSRSVRYMEGNIAIDPLPTHILPLARVRDGAGLRAAGAPARRTILCSA